MVGVLLEGVVVPRGVVPADVVPRAVVPVAVQPVPPPQTRARLLPLTRGARGGLIQSSLNHWETLGKVVNISPIFRVSSQENTNKVSKMTQIKGTNVIGPRTSQKPPRHSLRFTQLFRV